MIPDLPAGTVLGVGVDLVEIDRIRNMGARHGGRFLEKVFTAAERESLSGRADPWPGFAARFAAKEAVSKAFGTGIGAELDLTSVSVATDAAGAPHIELDAKGAALLAAKGGSRILISLTHTASLAQAFAVIVR
jgi:holo-[acyl-carrier protein] synthase